MGKKSKEKGSKMYTGLLFLSTSLILGVVASVFIPKIINYSSGVLYQNHKTNFGEPIVVRKDSNT